MIPLAIRVRWIASLAVMVTATISARAAVGTVEHDVVHHVITMADAKHDLVLRLNYDRACFLDSVLVRGREVVTSATGVCTAIMVTGQWTTTRSGLVTPTVTATVRRVVVDGIRYSAGGVGAVERWTFLVEDDCIDWSIERTYQTAGVVEDTYSPGWDFRQPDPWTGALLDTGGVAWGRLLTANTSYGAHTRSATFFNSGEDACLQITAAPSPASATAARFSRQPSGIFTFAQSTATREFLPANGLHRFNRSLDVWSPFGVEPATVTTALSIRVVDSDVVRGRGTFVGLDGGAIGNLLDTIGRYGVIDHGIMGGNGWLSGFFCLHKPFFAAMGLAIDDPA